MRKDYRFRTLRDNAGREYLLRETFLGGDFAVLHYATESPSGNLLWHLTYEGVSFDEIMPVRPEEQKP